MRWAGRSEVGPVRERNEDSAYAGPRLALIADGVGGMIAGEVASALALTAMRRLDADTANDVLDALSTALDAANARLRDAVAADPGLEGMGTTLTALLTNGTELGLAHVGDSRAYLLHEGRLHQISTDQTFVQTLVDEGRITADEARTHPHKSLILQALDGRTRIEPDLTRLELAVGDRFLLCSDGLSDVLQDSELADGLQVADPQQAADGLVQAALDGGASDNVTCLVVDAVDEAADAVDGATDEAVTGAAGEAVTGPLVLGAAADPQVAALVDNLGPGRPDAGVRGGASAGQLDRGAGATQLDRGADTTQLDRGGGATVLGDARRSPGSATAEEPEALRYAPREPSRYRWLARSLATVGVLALLAAGGDFAYDWTQDQYFVTAHDGRVAIYQGIPQHVPGLQLSHLYDVVEDLPVDALPQFFRRKVVGDAVTADNLPQAQAIVANLAGLAVRCGPTPTVTTPPISTPRPTVTSGLTATSAPSPSGAAAECAGSTDLSSPSGTPVPRPGGTGPAGTGPANTGTTAPPTTAAPTALTPRAVRTTSGITTKPPAPVAPARPIRTAR